SKPSWLRLTRAPISLQTPAVGLGSLDALLLKRQGCPKQASAVGKPKVAKAAPDSVAGSCTAAGTVTPHCASDFFTWNRRWRNCASPAGFHPANNPRRKWGETPEKRNPRRMQESRG